MNDPNIEVIREQANTVWTGKQFPAGTPIQVRLWGRTRTTDAGCWEYTGGLNRDGYPVQVRVDGRLFRANRLAWTLAVCAVADGMCVCHTCDNRACVRPSHMFLASHQANMDDRNTKGRARGGRLVGSANKHARLTEEDVRDMRRRHANGETVTAIGLVYGMKGNGVTRIVTGQRWAHVA